MSVSHSVYAVYGVVVAPPREREALDESLAAQAHRPASRNLADVRVQLFTAATTSTSFSEQATSSSDPTRTGQCPLSRSAPGGTTPCLSR